MKIFGRTTSDSDLSARWAEVMGPDITAKATLVGLSKTRTARTMTIRATSPAYALELSYSAEEIRKKANSYFGYDAIAKIRITK